MWNFPIFPEQASTLASRVDWVYLAVMGVAVLFTAFIVVLAIVLSARYRRGRPVNRAGAPATSIRVELTWMLLPLLIGILLFIWAAMVYFEQYAAPPGSYEVYVVGKQWMFKLQHPGGKREISELHIPIGRPVKLIMTSQDVIHSLYIPAFRLKQDLVPGRLTEMWFEPTKIGRYHLFCAEYCGTEHSVMGGTVHVMSPSDYEGWLAQGDTGLTMAREGEDLFVRHHCSGCHGMNATVKAPPLRGVYGRPVPIQSGDEVRFVQADDRYIRDSILLPKQEIVAGYEPVMPSYAGQIGEDDLLKLIAYIKSLGTQGVGP